MTREVKSVLYDKGFDFITMADSGSKDGVSLWITLNNEHSASVYTNEKGNAVLRIDNLEQAVECTSAEQVIDIIKMSESLLGTEFFYFREEVA